MMKPTTARNILIGLLLFLGFGAMGGGVCLIISPSGKLLGGLPLSILEHSPFADFLIPGIILFFVLGIAPCLLSFALIKKPTNKLAEHFNFFKDMHWAWSFTIYVAFALIIWIQVETIFVQSVGWLQTFYMLYAIPLILVALLPQIRTIYKK
jgi:magnesium-transporting ATPase (P-type)